jgi:hypothetical protein
MKMKQFQSVKQIVLKWLVVFLLPAGVVGLAGCHNSASNEPKESPVVLMLRKIWPDPQKQQQKIWESLSSPDADVRREGVYLLREKPANGWDKTPQILNIMCQGDPDGQVRAVALKVLAELDSKDTYLPVALKAAAKDQMAPVRRESVSIMSRRSDDASMERLLDMLNHDEDREVRSGAAAALANYNDRRSMRGLIRALTDEQFGVSYRARESLEKLTGVNYGYDQQAWLTWLSSKDNDKAAN